MEPTVVWRRPAKSGPRTPLVIFLHGRGADEHDLIDLAAELPKPFEGDSGSIVPRWSPVTLGIGG